MSYKSILCFALLMLLPGLALTQDGKLRGKVTDRESGEALIGANVVIEGTSLGAATDVNGEYVILSVPTGVYSVKVTYIGYSPVTISNIRVSSNITTTQDFQPSSSAVQFQAVEIVAERPLVQRNTTNTVRIGTQETIRNMPFRGLQNIVALEASVVQQGGNIYVRGGRAGDVNYYVDGTNVTNPVLRADAANNTNVNLIQEALEEFQMQAGGYTAELGGANSGIVRSTLRTGGEKLKLTGDYQTDDFAKPGREFLGTTSRGFRNAVLTLGGPVPLLDKARFFVAFQHNYERNRRAMFLEPFVFENLVTDAVGSYPAGTPLPGPVEFKKNYLHNNWTESNVLQGTLVYNIHPFKIRFTGNYEKFQNPNGGNWPGALEEYFNQKRNTITATDRQLASLRVTHMIGKETFYEIAVSYQNSFATTFDQDFKDDWYNYADSLKNAELGYTGFVSRYGAPYNYSVINAFNFTHPNFPNNSYSKRLQRSISSTIDLTSQVTSNWELKAGGSIESWISRNFNVGNISMLRQYNDSNGDGIDDRTFESEQAKRVNWIKRGAMNNWGYDIYGNEVESGFDAPRKPLFAAAYIQNKFEYDDLVLNFGVRYEYSDGDALRVPQEKMKDPDADNNLDVIDETKLIETDPISLLLPRVSFSFPVTDRTVFYALYGKYAQFPSLNQMYINSVQLSTELLPTQRTPYWLGGNLIGFMLRPERTTQYEMGLRQAVSDNFAFTLTGFYRDLKDQIQVRRVYDENGNPYTVALMNEDFGTTKGVELTLELRRTNRLAARVNYTLSDARGASSTSTSSSYSVSDEVTARFPLFINPFDYNQAHRGSVMLDYRFAKDEGGPILEGMGVNLLLSFNSGHPYTKIEEPRNLGQSNPWTVGVRATIDLRSRNPVEPINSSTTPWVFNIDLNWSKMFYFGGFNAELYVNVLNLLNTKQILDVHPTTGTPTDDGWLKSPLAAQYRETPMYEEFYKVINLQNRWAWLGIAGKAGSDFYGSPRQVRAGVRLEL